MNKETFYTLITGSSSGIGKAFARKCAAEKMNLILVSLPDTGLEEYGEELRAEFGVEVHTLPQNLAKENASLRVYEICHTHGWRINMLINNVGLGNVGAFEESSLTGVQYMMTLNMNVMVGLTQLFLPQIKQSGQGYILNVSSLAGMFPVPYKSIYSASKSFVYSFSRSLYFELEEENVMVSCLCPGPTATNGQVLETNRQLGWKARYFTKSAEEVATIGIDGMLRRQFMIIPGWENRLINWVGKILPQSLLLRYMGKTFKKRTPYSGEMQWEEVAGSSSVANA